MAYQARQAIPMAMSAYPRNLLVRTNGPKLFPLAELS